jgi:hypothetical protein
MTAIKFTRVIQAALIIMTVLLNSCAETKPIIFSDNRYKPIEKVETSQYKSPQERKGQDNNNALGIAISGGGSRAQYFGLGILIGLDEIKNSEKSFLNEIDYFSTVSGGGFAAGYYLSLKKHEVLDGYTNFFDFWNSKDRKDSLQEFLFMDAKAGIFKLLKKTNQFEKNKQRKKYPAMIDYELLQYGKTFRKPINRLSLNDFFLPVDSKGSVTMPMFVTNGTIYNNGERLPFMPHIIDSLHIIGSLLPPEPFEIDNGYGLPLSYAITGSAAFPGVLPMLKFSIKDKPKNVIRVIDGGAVDNLGFTTLFELLHSDKTKKKSALVVDCGGFGKEIQEQDAGKVGVVKLLKKSLLYTVDINLLYSDENMKYLANYYSLDTSKIRRIGFSTIKHKFIGLENKADTVALKALSELKDSIVCGQYDWEKLYKVFAHSKGFSKHKDSLLNVSTIPTSNFEKFNMRDIFILYELSSQIETKIKIYEWEKEILILAGRFAVYTKRDEIQKLLN